MFENLIIQPIFNLLVLIYALIPGHDFGVAIILFTVLIRVLMWPMLKKQLHQTRLMRMLQPKVKEVKAKAKGDRQKEGQMLMELYKEYGVSPFTSLGLLFVQLPIFIGLFSALTRLINDPNRIVADSYGWVKNLPHMKEVVADISRFDEGFLGLFNATQRAFDNGTIIWPIVVVALLAGVFQFLQTRQLSPATNKSKSLKDIMRESAQGKQVDQGEINAAVGRNVGFFFSPLIALAAASSPAGVALYLATGGLVGLVQQKYILSRDVQEMEDISDRKSKRAAKAPADKPKKRPNRPAKKARR